MELQKIINTSKIQCYYIKNPSKVIKKAYPKKFIYSILTQNGDIKIYNTNKLNYYMFLFNTGFVFTYYNDKQLGKMFSDKNVDKPITYPNGELNNYLDEENNVILNVTTRDKEIPPRLLYDIIIKTNSKLINKLSEKELKNAIKNAILNNIGDEEYTVESWISEILQNIPISQSELKRFPNIINNKNINNLNIKLENLCFEYNIHCSDRVNEIDTISKIEKTLDNINEVVYVYNTYNDILKKIISQAVKQKIKFKMLNENKLSIKYSDLCKIKIDYTINDFI